MKGDGRWRGTRRESLMGASFRLSGFTSIAHRSGRSGRLGHRMDYGWRRVVEPNLSPSLDARQPEAGLTDASKNYRDRRRVACRRQGGETCVRPQDPGLLEPLARKVAIKDGGGHITS